MSDEEYYQSNLFEEDDDEASVQPPAPAPLEISKPPNKTMRQTMALTTTTDVDKQERKMRSSAQITVESLDKYNCDCGSAACKNLNRDQVNIMTTNIGGSNTRFISRKGSRSCYVSVSEKMQKAAKAAKEKKS